MPGLEGEFESCLKQVFKLCLEKSETQLFAATPQNVLGFWPPTHVKALGIGVGGQISLGFPEI